MRKSLLVLIAVLFEQLSFCQQGTAPFSLTYSNPQNSFMDSVDVNDPLFNGMQHSGYLPSIEGIAYYKTSDWQNGSIIYRDIFYPHVQLKYNLVEDQVIVRHPNGYTMVALFTPRIQSFTFQDYRFVYLDDSSLHIPRGIYHVVIKGPISLYIKHSKFIEEKVGQTQIERKFLEKDLYYAVKDGTFYPINKQQNLLELVKEQRGEIRSYLRSKKIKFKRNQAAAIPEIIQYYNSH